MSKRSVIAKCPRCGNHNFESLESYGHCSECLYHEDFSFSFEELLADATRLEAMLANEKTKSHPAVRIH